MDVECVPAVRIRLSLDPAPGQQRNSDMPVDSVFKPVSLDNALQGNDRIKEQKKQSGYLLTLNIK
jgi:hypothetical protein